MIHCPTCGAGLRFDIKTQQMACDYCNNHFDINHIHDNKNDAAKGETAFESYVYICPDCGAELAAGDKTDAIGFCPYCGGSSMLYDRICVEWKPDFVIPFRVSKEQCKAAYLKEVKKHPFVSGKYKKPELIESFRGIYMPYWYYDGIANGSYSVEEKKDSGSHVSVYEQVYYFDNYYLTGVEHDASSNFDDHISERLEPFPGMNKKPYHPGYLSGFYAEISDINKDEYKDYAEEIFHDYALSRQNKNKIKKENVKTKVEALQCGLHPVWFMSYRRKNKLTYAAVNGATGKVSADLPTSPLRVMLAALLSSAVLFGLIYLIMNLLPSMTAANTLVVCSLIAAAGAYFLHKGHLETVGESLKMPGYRPSPKEIKIVTAVCWGLIVLGTMMTITDGSFAHSRAGFGMILAIPSFCFCVFQMIKQTMLSGRINRDLNANKISQLENGIIKSAKVYNRVFSALKLLTYLTGSGFFILGIGNVLPKFLNYVMCGVLAAEIILQAMLYIHFQVKVAHRRPPQMEKKGALYDEK